MATTACVSAGVMTSAEGGRDAEMRGLKDGCPVEGLERQRHFRPSTPPRFCRAINWFKPTTVVKPNPSSVLVPCSPSSAGILWIRSRNRLAPAAQVVKDSQQHYYEGNRVSNPESHETFGGNDNFRVGCAQSHYQTHFPTQR